jgi:hypothetical protein
MRPPGSAAPQCQPEPGGSSQGTHRLSGRAPGAAAGASLFFAAGGVACCTCNAAVWLLELVERQAGPSRSTVEFAGGRLSGHPTGQNWAIPHEPGKTSHRNGIAVPVVAQSHAVKSQRVV